VLYNKNPPTPCSRLFVKGWKKNLAVHAGGQANHTKKAHAVMQRYGLLLAAVAAKKACLQIQPFFASLSRAFSLTSLISGAKLPVQSDQSNGCFHSESAIILEALKLDSVSVDDLKIKICHNVTMSTVSRYLNIP